MKSETTTTTATIEPTFAPCCGLDPEAPGSRLPEKKPWWLPPQDRVDRMPPMLRPRSFEDRIFATMLKVISYMNDQIEAQQKVVEGLISGKGKKDDDALDTEVAKLQRMIDKREQLFGTLMKIVQKFSEQTSTFLKNWR
jgi:hypothetical protein